MRRKAPLTDDAWRKTPAKKDTHRWCRGKVGVEHQPEIVMMKWGYRPEACQPAAEWARKLFGNEWRCFHQTECSVCHKVMASVKPENCPDNPKRVTS